MLTSALARIRAYLAGHNGSGVADNRRRRRAACQHFAIVTRGTLRYRVSLVNIGMMGLGLEGGKASAPGDKFFLSPQTYGPSSEEQKVEVEVVWCYSRDFDARTITGVTFVSPQNQSQGTWMGKLLKEAFTMGANREQARKHVRMNSVLKAEIRRLDQGSFLLEGDVANISVGGALIKCRNVLQSTAPLLVLIGPYTNYPTFYLHARLVNSRAHNDGNQEYLHALEFVDVSSEQREMLATLVNRLIEEHGD